MYGIGIALANEVPTAVSSVSSVVTSDMVGGVLNEVVALLPVMIPAMISFIALRKGIAFVKSVLHSA